MTKHLNGTAKWLIGIILVLASGVGGWAILKIDGHEDLIGHPVIIERVSALQADVAEIKVGVQTLVERKP